MKKTLSIGDISSVLNISTSKLRFWEKKGLIQIFKNTNRYRSYTTTDLIQIADILFYRNMGISIDKIKEFDSVSLSEYGNSLQSFQRQLSDKIHEYDGMYQRVCRQQQYYYKLLQLMVQPFAMEAPAFSYVAGWDFREKERILSYVDDPSRYVWYEDTNDDHESHGQKGIIVSSMPKEGEPPLLWSKPSHAKFITFPVKAIVENNYEGLEATETVTKLKRQYKTGIYLAQHLLTCTENNQRVEYLQGFLQILS